MPVFNAGVTGSQGCMVAGSAAASLNLSMQTTLGVGGAGGHLVDEGMPSVISREFMVHLVCCMFLDWQLLRSLMSLPHYQPEKRCTERICCVCGMLLLRACSFQPFSL